MNINRNFDRDLIFFYDGYPRIVKGIIFFSFFFLIYMVLREDYQRP